MLMVEVLWQNPGREDVPPSSYFIFKESCWESCRSALFTFYFIDEEPEVQGSYAIFKVQFYTPLAYIKKIAAIGLNIGLKQPKTVCE